MKREAERDGASPLVLDLAARCPHLERGALISGPAATLVDVAGVEAWAVADPAVLAPLLTDSRVSKDPNRGWPAFQRGEIVGTWALEPWVSVRNMLCADGADHRRLRSVMSTAFTPRRTAALVPRVEAIAADLLDRMAELPTDRPVDLREHYAYPLPMRVIGELLGVPEQAARPEFRAIVDGVFASHFTPEESHANLKAFRETLNGMLETKRAEPGDDLTSMLVAAHDNGEEGKSLDDGELTDTFSIVFGAGYETTVNLLDTAVTGLLDHPDQLARARSGEVAWSEVVEEALRFEAPIPYLPLRYALEDIELADGTVIPAGEPILAAFGAAGRHPDAHGETADAFDITRPDKKHFSFGHGAHFCLGAPLARAEAAVALPALFERFPALALAVPAEELEPVGSIVSNGHKSLPVWLAGPPR